jgi:hypothetical protein
MTWEKCYSNTHKQFYYFNTLEGSKSWSEPAGYIEKKSIDNNANAEKSSSSRKRTFEETGKEEIVGKMRENDTKAVPLLASPVVGIIVPFRDLHEEQKRSQHLHRFIPDMSQFLMQSNKPFRIYIIEQSDDGRKFNRGKLLNIGFDLAKNDGCKVFVFHDVDLIPCPLLLPFYTDNPPAQGPVHIARVWDRYNENKMYFGGIVAFSADQYSCINGYPNTFWGWGGEDDEMMKRIQLQKLTPTSPSSGTIQDLEEMTLQSKLQFLRKNSVWKCMNKFELLKEHSSTWDSNGLKDLKYSVLKRQDTDACATHKSSNSGGRGSVSRITVDVLLNQHWTDLACGIDDSQLEVSVEVLQAQFRAQKR